jgi:hypothetical protein
MGIGIIIAKNKLNSAICSLFRWRPFGAIGSNIADKSRAPELNQRQAPLVADSSLEASLSLLLIPCALLPAQSLLMCLQKRDDK